MTRKRVTASEKKQRHEWAVRQIGAEYFRGFDRCYLAGN